jgi:tripartite-type tricarboxylate transporter receptor subunit TctC
MAVELRALRPSFAAEGGGIDLSQPMDPGSISMVPRAVVNYPLAIAWIATALVAGAAFAQTREDPKNYPSRPIRVIVGNTAGSAQDIVSRLVAQRLTDSMGQQTVVDNRAGATGQIGMEITWKAAPDGYTLTITTSAALVLNPLLTRVPYDPYKDFTPISLLVDSPQLLFATTAIPAKTVSELLDLARAKPGQLNCASPGFGGSNHMGCEMLKTMGKVNIVHVPYKGTSPAITDVMGGHAQFMFNSIPAVIGIIKSGKVRAIGHGGTKRSPALPDVPTIAETLPGFQVGTWYALAGPAGLPPAIVARLNAEVKKMFGDPQFAQKIVDLGQDPAPTTPAELTAHMRNEADRWTKVIKEAGLKPER